MSWCRARESSSNSTQVVSTISEPNELEAHPCLLPKWLPFDGLADPQISDPPVVTPGASTGAREIRQREVRWTCSDVARTSPSRPVRVAGDRWECGAGGAMVEGGGRHPGDHVLPDVPVRQ